jgi:hypothetical protein
VSLWDALLYPFRLESNRRVIILGLILLFIPVIGWIIWAGYLLSVICAVINGNERALPRFNLRSDLNKGLGLAISVVCFLLPPVVLAFLAGLAIGVIFGRQGQAMVNFVLPIIWIIYIFSLLAFYIGRLHAAESEDLTRLFALRDNYSKVPGAFGMIFMAGLRQIVLQACFILILMNAQALVISLAYILPNSFFMVLIVVVLLLIDFAYVVLSLQSAHLDAQLAKRINFAAELQEYDGEKAKRL